MNVWDGTPYAKLFKGSSKRAARLDMQLPSRPVDLKNLVLEAMTSSMSTWIRPLDSWNIKLNSTKQRSITKIISVNTDNGLIMSKLALIAPRQLPVIFLPLLVLLLIITKCSSSCSSPVEYSQKVLEVVHGVFIWQWQLQLQWGND
jgi:hypothetical protein